MMRITQRIAERNRDYYDKKPVTIVCLGDSVTHGCFDVFVNRSGRWTRSAILPRAIPCFCRRPFCGCSPFRR